MLSLEKTLAYENPVLLEHFATYYFAMSPEETNDVFTEMKRWLWLCAQAYDDRQSGKPDVPQRLNVQSGMVIIDVLWHVFILHSREYAKFCEEHFGKFIHHSPAHPEFEPPTAEETALQMSYIWDQAGGETTLKKWYVEYADKYSPDNIRRLQIPFHVIR